MSKATVQWKRQLEEESAALSRSRSASKVSRFCVFGVLLPLVLFIIPLYARIKLTLPTVHPIVPSDQLFLDQHVSTFWCKGQKIESDTDFNAWLVSNSSWLVEMKQRVNLNKKLVMKRDTEEYWGFYLMKGSHLYMQFCARYPGGNLIVIKGARCLKVCALVDDKDGEEIKDSIEEDLSDRNGSEQISSHSSSEEALLACPCQGVKFYIPIVPTRSCKAGFLNSSISYKVDSDDHYYILFSNDNEVFDNLIYFNVTIMKSLYNVSNSVQSCANSTNCEFQLDFYSAQRAIIEKPFTLKSSNFDVSHFVYSECLPRAPVYMAFYATIPIFILFAAFS